MAAGIEFPIETSPQTYSCSDFRLCPLVLSGERADQDRRRGACGFTNKPIHRLCLGHRRVSAFNASSPAVSQYDVVARWHSAPAGQRVPSLSAQEKSAGW